MIYLEKSPNATPNEEWTSRKNGYKWALQLLGDVRKGSFWWLDQARTTIPAQHHQKWTSRASGWNKK